VSATLRLEGALRFYEHPGRVFPFTIDEAAEPYGFAFSLQVSSCDAGTYVVGDGRPTLGEAIAAVVARALLELARHERGEGP